jgi:hypothetical protein
MILYPQSAELYAFEFTGIFVNLTIDNLEPIRVNLESEGGKISFFKIFNVEDLASQYWLVYKTNDLKIEIRVPQTRDQYRHHVDFFGGNVEYTSGIPFKLVDNKFVML